MNVTLTQEDIDIFSSDPSGVKERPSNLLYLNGVDTGYTAPAKWWNWLWNKITGFFAYGKADRVELLAEMTNVLTAGNIIPDVTNDKQLYQAVNQVMLDETEAYDNETVTEEIGGVMVTHPKNRPYVVGHTVYYPDTELL